MAPIKLKNIQFKQQFFVAGELVRNVPEATLFPDCQLVEFCVAGRFFVKPWSDVDFAVRDIPVTAETKVRKIVK